MGFSLSPVKSTLHTAIAKPNIHNVAAAAIMVTPLGMAGTLAVGNKDAIKSTLHTAGTTVKNDSKIIGTSTLSASKTVAHGAGKAAHSVASGFTHMLYMGGAALVGIIILKMTVFK